MHYAALGQPQDTGEFITVQQDRLRTSLDRFEQALAEGITGGVAIVKKHGEPWISVSPRGKQEKPESLVAIKGEIERRWCTFSELCEAAESTAAGGVLASSVRTAIWPNVGMPRLTTVDRRAASLPS